MVQLPRRIFSLIRDNQPMKKSVIDNPTFVSSGYGLSLCAMGAETSIPAERVKRPALYIVMQGELLIEVHDEQPYRTIVLKPGEVYVRHTDVLVGFRANVDCIFMSQSFRDTAEFAEEINFVEKMPLDQWLSLAGPESYRVILDGKSLFGGFFGYTEGTQWSSKVVQGSTLYICLEGSIRMTLEDGRIYEMRPWDAVFLRPTRYPRIDVEATRDTRALRLWKLY